MPASPPDDQPELSLDPAEWNTFRALAHEALDLVVDSLESVRRRPVWQPVPADVRGQLSEPLPTEPQGIERACRECETLIFPYPTGNIHPRFFGWVHGTGLASGLIAEMFAAAMNSNCGGRDHGAVYVERCVIEWCKQALGYPRTASGLIVSGTSMANLIGLTVARNAHSTYDVRREGVAGSKKRLIAYASVEVHESVTKALEILGMGSSSLRKIAADSRFRMDLAELHRTIKEDRAADLQPFCVIGSAGTVNTGAIDDLKGLAEICGAENLWFHVDGAFGALCVLNETLRPKVNGIECADSVAFDFHKWMHVQYDAGCILVRQADLHREAFSARPTYLEGADRGLSGGGHWFCEFGPELSRSFRALKVWFAFKEHGTRRLGEAILQNCRQAEYLSELIQRTAGLELLAEPTLNIVCFRFRGGESDEELDRVNAQIVADLHESGIAAPSTTRVKGKLAVRVALTNHRTRREDLDVLIRAVVAIGKSRTEDP